VEEKGLIGAMMQQINVNMSLNLDTDYVTDRSGEKLAQTLNHWVVVGGQPRQGVGG